MIQVGSQSYVTFTSKALSDILDVRKQPPPFLNYDDTRMAFSNVFWR
jgi:hypothetical protein